MKIGIVGAGAVGGYFGGMLHQAGEDVVFYVRPRKAELLRRDGLRVQSVHGDFSLQPKITTDPRDLQAVDVIILAVKNYHLEPAIPDLEVMADGGAVLLPLLNGVHHLDALAQIFGRERTLGGSCYIEVTLNEEGQIVQSSEARDIVYGPLQEPPSSAVAGTLLHLSNAFERSAIPAFQRQNIVSEMWKKYIFLCAFSGVTAASRSRIGTVFKHKSTRHIFVGLLDELITVARAIDIQLPEKLPDSLLQRAEGLDPMMTSSMHRDLEKGLPLELDYLQGSLRKMARELGVKTPFHDFVYGVLVPYKHGSM